MTEDTPTAEEAQSEKTRENSEEPVRPDVSKEESGPGGTPAPEGGPDAPKPEKSAGPKPSLSDKEQEQVVEALLFSSDRPLGTARLASILGKGIRGTHVREAIRRLSQKYEEDQRAFEILEIAGGFQMMTREAYHDWIRKLRSEEKSARLSEAALDTLAVVAYRQPILKADINHIRGVESGPLLRTLIEKNLIRISGRADQPGRPILYGTTKRFLEVFGLKSLRELPQPDSLG